MAPPSTLQKKRSGDDREKDKKVQAVRQAVAAAHMQTQMETKMGLSGIPGPHEMLPDRVTGQPNNGQRKGDRGSWNGNQTPVPSLTSWFDYKNGRGGLVDADVVFPGASQGNVLSSVSESDGSGSEQTVANSNGTKRKKTRKGPDSRGQKQQRRNLNQFQMKNLSGKVGRGGLVDADVVFPGASQCNVLSTMSESDGSGGEQTVANSNGTKRKKTRKGPDSRGQKQQRRNFNGFQQKNPSGKGGPDIQVQFE